MGKALTVKDDNARVNPYPTSKPTKREEKAGTDKENVGAKSTPEPKASKRATAAQEQYGDWRDIPLEEVHGEVPCHDDASTVRRKLNSLVRDKKDIPGSKKKWSQAALAKEMADLERREGAVGYGQNFTGPTAGSTAKFLKKSGKMGGGDSPAYYWGYVLCEKLRIWEGAKKTKTREETEKK